MLRDITNLRGYSRNRIIIVTTVCVCFFMMLLFAFFFLRGRNWSSVDWNTVENYIRPDGPVKTSNWVIMTSIGKPDMPAIQKLFTLKSWQFVNVADTKTPDWTEVDLPPNVHFLSVKEQEEMEYRILKHIPYKHYGRKNIGYLYAIERGATVIYETDDDTILVGKTLEFINEWETPQVETLSSSIGLVNVYPFFEDADKGDHYIWPRGLPLQALPQVKKDGVVKKCGKKSTFTPVQQYMQDVDPDVDAIYRLTHSEIISSEKPFRFRKKEMISLPPGVLHPYNTQNTITTYSAFWGLLLPVNVAFRVTDIWRGYWAQRILWEIGGRLTFGSATCDHIRNPHDYFADFLDEEQLYYDSQKFVDLLLEWRRSPEMSLFDSILDLSERMVEEEIWPLEDHKMMKDWLLDLIEIGYKPPRTVDVSFQTRDDGMVNC